MRVTLISIRTESEHFAVNNLIDGGLKMVRTNKFQRVHSATIPSHESDVVRYMIETLEKWIETPEGRSAMEHYLSVIFAYWHD